MNEVEVKILEIDRDAVVSRLEELGAEKVFDDEMYAVYLDYDDERLKRYGDLLRLRKEGSRVMLTFKKHVSDTPAKVREEYETPVADFGTTRDLFRRLGFIEWLVVRKRRVSYELDGTHYDIDRYLDDFGHIPEFLEIDARDMESLSKGIELLGFSGEDCKPWTFVDLAMHYSGGK
ncbi:MAG: class IV adenylate cyclase [Nitrospirota bacterium]|nr:MAG: class IV adenylate cyclase [Nitrospirota bacterium]